MDIKYEAERLEMLQRRGYPPDVILQDRKLTPREKRRVKQMAEDTETARYV